MKSLRPIVSLLALTAALAGCSTAGSLGESNAQERAALFASQGANDRVAVTLHFGTRQKLEALSKAGIDLFENVDMEKGTVGATLTSATEPVVRKLGVKYQIQQNFGRLKGPMPSGYQTVDAIYKDLAAVAAKHPNIVRLEKIGESIQGRPVWAARITSNPAAKLPATRIASGVHARELPPVELTMRLVHLLAESYGTDARITKLVDTRDIWIVPVQNPDGRLRVEGGSAMWRKNVRKNNAFSEGVDINRNGDDHWNQGNDNSSADDYHGASPFSEPESQAIRDLALKVKFATSIDVHCYGGMILWPPGFSNEFSKDEAAFAAIGNAMAKPMGYKAGTIARTIYKTFGDLATWEYNTTGTLAFAAELKVNGFNPSFSEVDKQWSDWKPNFLHLIDVSGNPRGAAGPMSSLNVFPTR